MKNKINIKKYIINRKDQLHELDYLKGLRKNLNKEIKRLNEKMRGWDVALIQSDTIKNNGTKNK